MESITIYRITVSEAVNASELGEKYSLVPYADYTRTTKGHDDGGVSYIMPEEFSIGQNIYALPAFFDGDGSVCTLEDQGGKPVIKTAKGAVYELQRA